MAEETEGKETIAWIEFTKGGDGEFQMGVSVVDGNEDTPEALLCHYIGRNAHALLQLARAEREAAAQAHREGYMEANTRQVIESAARKIVGPDNKPIN